MPRPWLFALPALAFVLQARLALKPGLSVPLLLDDAAFVVAFVLGLQCAARREWIWSRRVLAALVAGGASFTYLINTAYTRYFNDFFAAQELADWEVNRTLAIEGLAFLMPADFLLGWLVPLSLALALCQARARPLSRRALTGLIAGFVLCEAAHHATAAREFVMGHHNAVLNLARDGLRATLLRPIERVRFRERIGEVAGFYAVDVPGYRRGGDPAHPLVKEPLQAASASPRPPNVVLIVVESLRARECGAYGAAPSFTPVLDGLARDGLVFERFYANGSYTVKGLIALLFSFYPMLGSTEVSSLVRPPRLRSLASALATHGYSSFYMCAYSPTFANIGPFLRAHGFDAVHGGEELPPGLPELGWGPPDHEMFTAAARVMDGKRQPFFATLMTLSSHFPWRGEYPTAARTPVITRDPIYQRYMNGVYYADWALGGFLETLRAKPWFANTMFVITGDHGTWRFPAESALSPLEKQEAFFRVPLVVYAPGSVPPRRVPEVGSQIDFAPTLLDLLGLRARNAFAGRSLLAPAPERIAFMAHTLIWNLRRGDRYVYDLGPDGADEGRSSAYVADQRDNHAYFVCEQDLLRGAGAMRPLEPEAERVRLSSWAEDLIFFNRNLILQDAIWSDLPGATP